MTKAPAKSASRKAGGRLSSSHCASEYSRRVSIRPASESDNLGSSSTFADPVRRNRPGRRSRSTLAFNEVNSDGDRKSTRLNSSHLVNSYAVFCLKKKK